MRVALSLLVASLVPLVPSAQQAVFVGPGGDVQAAIDAAAPGDTVYVAAGSFAPFTVDKAIQVIGEGSALTSVTATGACDQPMVEAACLHVTGIPVGSTAVVSGFRFNGTFPGSSPFFPCEGSAVLLDASLGTVILDDVVVLSGGSAIAVANVGLALLESSSFATQASNSWSLPSTIGRSAVRVLNSEIWLIESLVPAPAPGSSTQTTGFDALFLSNSVLYGANVTIRGGYAVGGGVFCCCSGFGPGLAGGDGVVGTTTSLVRLVGDGTAVSGGSGSGSAGGTCIGAGGAGIVGPNMPVDLGPGVTVEGGPDSFGTTTGPAVSGTTPAALVDRRPVLVLDAVAPALSLKGNALKTATVFYSLMDGPPTVVGGVDGAAVLDLGRTLPLVTLALDGSGSASQTLPALPSPLPSALYGTTVFLQALEFGTDPFGNTTRYLSSPAVWPLRP